MPTHRNLAAAGLILLSFALLIPGLTRPLITISASIQFLGNSQEIFRETRSILKTIESLHDSGNDFVAGLVLLFSVVVPFAKGLSLLSLYVLRDWTTRSRIFRFIGAIGKWSMADVFLVGVYVAFLSAKATDNLDATLEVGFYYFAAYCLVSILSHQMMRLEGHAAQ